MAVSNQASPTTVLIVDDHHLWRRGLRRALEPECKIMAEATDGYQAVSLALEHRPDVVLMDVHMPSLGGIEAVQRIRQQLPDIPIIMVSASDEDEDIFDAVQVGVNGYLIKGEQPEAIPLAIREVVGGHAYLSPRVTKRILIGVSQALSQHSEIKPRSGLSALTARELTVLRLLGDGSRNRDIAQCLCVSERTVANDIASLYRKLDLSDRTQAVRYAMKHGLTEMAPPE